jgi:hypothetical protein
MGYALHSQKIPPVWVVQSTFFITYRSGVKKVNTLYILR